MPKIKTLSPHEAQKIAAGEVVERPANIVKELVENALDADARAVNVYIEDGGKQLIRVVDNGCGMDATDAQLCFGKHTTSKITHVDALEQINTFGFRGEALASVAAVSKVTLTTKEQNAPEGVKVTVEQNAIIDTQPVPANTGTDICVHELFYNIPARKKFLKTRETEWRHTLQLMQAFCLSYPDVHFKLFSDGKQILNCPAVEQLHARFAQVWDQHIANDVLNIEAQREDKTVCIAGVITNHQQFRYDRNGIFFFVNKRWVKNFKLTNALLKGYNNVLPHGKYPTACVHITVDPTLVDINIHPRKEEVKFMHPRIVEQLIQHTVKQALENHISANINSAISATPDVLAPPVQSFASSPPSRTFVPYDFGKGTSFDSASLSLQSSPRLRPTGRTNGERENPVFSKDSADVKTTPDRQNKVHETESKEANTSPFQSQNEKNQENIQELFEEPQSQKKISPAQQVHIIGQYHKTYILIEQQDGLFLVDQHAAHERILYELFSKTFKNIPTINLLFPQIINLSHADVHTITPHLTLFKQNGIGIEPFGENQLIVQSTPVHLKNVNLDDLVKQVIGWIHEYQHVEQETFFKTINEKLHAQMACKAAVKAGDTLTHEQMQTILTDLHNTANRFSCPHGRPTGFLLSLHDIEKRFKRKL